MLPVGARGVGAVDRCRLEALQRRWGDVWERALEKERDDRLGAVGLELRPLRRLPARCQHRQRDAARLAARLDLAMPVAARVQARAIEPNVEASGAELAMYQLRMPQIARLIADEGIVAR